MPTKRLLICTQKVDKDDPILGFFHEWITALAPQYAHITVVCLEKGNAVLPDNVTVRSLGKEVKKSRIQYIVLFYSAIFTIQYDAVFVHMNEEYVLLGGLYWRLLGKRVSLWRNHIQGSWKTRLAVFFSHQVFCTSPSSYTARFKKTVLMPVGIDTKRFREFPIKKDDKSIIYVGRISPVKNLEVLIEAIGIMKIKGITSRLIIYGPVVDTLYGKKINRMVKENNLEDIVFIKGSIAPCDLPEVYNRATICVNMTGAGSLDKTIYESILCGTFPVVTNEGIVSIIPEGDRQNIIVKPCTSHGLADKLSLAMSLSLEHRKEIIGHMQHNIIRQHSLYELIERFSKII